MPILNVTLGQENFNYNLALVKGLPPEYRQWDTQNKRWKIVLNDDTIDQLRKMSILVGVCDKYEENKKQEVERKKISDIEMNVGATALREKYKFLYEYQAVAAQYILTRKKFLVADAVGTGKTICCMPVVDQVVRSGGRVLILCPGAIGKQWQNEINRFLGHGSCLLIKQLKQKRMEGYNSSAKIIITSYESYKNDYKEVESFDLVISDEASKYKNHTSGIYRMMKQVARHCEYFVALSGTPIENCLENFFNILSIINPNFMSRERFKERYTVTKMGRYGEVVTEYKNLSNFLYLVSEHMIRRRVEDIGREMPELTVQNRIIPLTNAQKRYAYEIREYAKKNDAGGILILLNEVGNDVNLIDKSDSLTACELRRKGKLPYITDNEPSNKLEELYSVLDDLDGAPVLIFTQYKMMALKITEELIKRKYKVVCLTGDDSQRTRDTAIEDMKNGKYQIMIATEIFSYGVNLQFVNYELNFDIPYNPSKLTQRYGRIRRQGMEIPHPKLVINLVSEDIDERILSIVEKKQDLFDAVCDGGIINDESIRKQILQKLL